MSDKQGCERHHLLLCTQCAHDDYVRGLRKNRDAIRAAGFELTARLCGIAVVAEKDGYELIRRESVMDFVVRWRQAVDQA